MNREQISGPVQEFINDHIESVGQLRVLLLLFDSPGKNWRLDALCRQLHMSEPEAENHLAFLGDQGLVVCARNPARVYQYFPLPGKEAILREIAQLDRHRPVTLINLIYARDQRSK